MNIVEIHTQSGSQYTITDFGDLITLNVTRPEGHYLGTHQFATLESWTLRVEQGVLVGFFTLNPGEGPDTIRTSAVTDVRQQIVKGAFV